MVKQIRIRNSQLEFRMTMQIIIILFVVVLIKEKSRKLLFVIPLFCLTNPIVSNRIQNGQFNSNCT